MIPVVSPAPAASVVGPSAAAGRGDLDVAVLFARADSVYKLLKGADVYDAERDARTYAGVLPVVAHPPCRAWGRLRQFAKPRDDEKALALFAVDRVRTLGGVLEHPACSSLWDAAGLPKPGQGSDAFGGFTLPIDQYWFGHRAAKATWLYVVGVPPKDLPPFPLRFGVPTHVVAPSRKKAASGSVARSWDKEYRPCVSKAEREHTPVALAVWLVDLARLCSFQFARVAA